MLIKVLFALELMFKVTVKGYCRKKISNYSLRENILIAVSKS